MRLKKPIRPCPLCGHDMGVRMTDASGLIRKQQDRDLLICRGCGGLSVVDRGKARKMTPDEKLVMRKMKWARNFRKRQKGILKTICPND